MRKFKQETYNVLDWKDACRLIQECFKVSGYDISDVEEWHNDSSEVYPVDLRDYDDDMRKEVARFVNDPETGNCGLHPLLLELAARGEIPEGNYLIEVCW
jgi:hypothetical protein